MPSCSSGFWVASTKNGLPSVIGLAADGDRLLLHRFEERRLRLGRGTVDLVGEDEVGEDRAGLELELLAAFGRVDDDVGADDVGGHQVGRELDPGELHLQGVGQGPDQQASCRAPAPLRASTWPPATRAVKGPFDDVLMADDHLRRLPTGGRRSRSRNSSNCCFNSSTLAMKSLPPPRLDRRPSRAESLEDGRRLNRGSRARVARMFGRADEYLAIRSRTKASHILIAATVVGTESSKRRLTRRFSFVKTKTESLDICQRSTAIDFECDPSASRASRGFALGETDQGVFNPGRLRCQGPVPRLAGGFLRPR